MKRFWQVSNILSLVFALMFNFLIGAQILDLPAIGEVSDKYATLLTPAAYAFSIWSVIYTLLIVFVIYQGRDIFKSDVNNSLPERTGPLFIVASICNGLWTYIFVKDFIGLSVIVLLLLTASLYLLLGRLRIAVDDAPVKTIAFAWWPLMFYAGWVTVALVVNVASWLKSLGVIVSPELACVALISLTSFLIILLATRNTRELLIASAWGIAAIGVRQMQIDGDMAVASVAFGSAGTLLIAGAIHGYMNRQSNPFLKLTN